MSSTEDDWFNADVATFGDRLAAAREAAGMTPEAFARRLGVKLTTLEKWEGDLLEPRANRLSMMSGILGVSMTWLITGTGEGIAHPEEDTTSQDVRDLLIEVRELRASMTAKAEQVGRLEKRLRRMIEEAQLA
ncbi:XRE family transcriptional regulator [Aliishimia ponticola]|uniref:XRE family transcriptional regulator n=1 Tax=Aliishimia ponticola TaxID=2499833 RepID=A0A4V3XK66_9RHOB|nr:helix-turn-helix transcriptional regulator [Aliishimia ponticola]THH35783.1 XRE family transcriptional regulator [Aliishimia ponticola]